MTQIAAYDEWSALEEVVLGSAEQLVIPGPHPIEFEPRHSLSARLTKWILYNLAKGWRAPEFFRRRFERELDEFEEALVRHGVSVRRPRPVQPQDDEPVGLGQMFARDPFMVVGPLAIEGRLQIEMRRKETRGFAELATDLRRGGRPVARLADQSAFLEGGDVIIDWPHVYVGIGKYGTNLAGAAWLQAQLGAEARVTPIRLSDPSILHLDCCMTLIGKGRGILHRQALDAPLPAPLAAYDFVEIDARERSEMAGNILMLDPETIIIQKRHRRLSEELTRRGYKIIALDFSAHAALEGAFRCATAPLRRRRDA